MKKKIKKKGEEEEEEEEEDHLTEPSEGKKKDQKLRLT